MADMVTQQAVVRKPQWMRESPAPQPPVRCSPGLQWLLSLLQVLYWLSLQPPQLPAPPRCALTRYSSLYTCDTHTNEGHVSEHGRTGIYA